MAGNKKIFDLPLRTGVTADDRLAIVDSGNTTTYSVKLSDLQDGTGVNSIDGLTGDVFVNGGQGISTNTSAQTITIDNVGVLSLQNLVGDVTLSGGTNVTITDNGTDTITIDAAGGGGGSSFFSADTDNNVLQIDRGHSFIPADSSNTMLYNFILGGSGNTMNNQTNTNHTAERNVMIGGYNNTFRPGSNNSSTRNAAIIGGQNHIFGRESDNSALIGGQGNSVSYGYRSVIAGGEGNLYSQTNNFLGGGKNNFVANNHSSIIAGESHYLFSAWGFIGGGYDHTINAYNKIGNGIIGGYINYMNNTERCFIGGGEECDVDGGATLISNSGVIGGRLNVVSGVSGLSSNSVIIGGETNIVKHSRSAIIAGQNQTTSYNDEVVMPSITLTLTTFLNYPDDASAAAAGLPIGAVYHDNGNLRIRIV
jgi:hypothetical protein